MGIDRGTLESMPGRPLTLAGALLLAGTALAAQPPLTEAQRAAQLMAVAFPTIGGAGMLEVWTRERGVGAVVIYKASGAELLDTTTRMHQIAPPGLLPLVAVDQEGGAVLRIPEAQIPGAMAIGATGSPEIARRAGLYAGCLLRTFGVTLLLAPVLDLSTELDGSRLGSRSFGSDPAQVARLGEGFIRGAAVAGVMTVAKHFPGQGSADADPHAERSRSARSAAELRSGDLVPFAAAIEAGVAGLMPAHVAYPGWPGSGDLPATSSTTLLRDLAREELRFEGIILTDALSMKGIRGSTAAGEVAVRAIEAGADMVLVTGRREAELTHAGLASAIRSGRLSAARVDESVARVLRLKRRAQERATPCAGEKDFGATLARAAMTSRGEVNVDLDGATYTGIDGPLALAFPDSRRVILPAALVGHQLAGRSAEIAAKIPLDGAWVAAIQNETQAGLIARVRELRPDARLTLVLFGSPGDARGISARGFLYAYSFLPESQQAALDVLRGERNAPGRLPIEQP